LEHVAGRAAGEYGVSSIGAASPAFAFARHLRVAAMWLAAAVEPPEVQVN